MSDINDIMAEEIIKLKEENIQLHDENSELRATNELLRNELIRTRKMITSLEEIKTVSAKFIRHCECSDNTSSSKIQLKLNKLKSNYDQLKNESNVAQITNKNGETRNFMLKSDLNQTTNVSNDTDLSEIKLAFNLNDNFINNQTSLIIPIGGQEKKKRGRKPKPKPLLSDDTNAENVSIDHNKLETIKEKKPKKKKIKTKCHWPGCDAVCKDDDEVKEHMWRHTGEKQFKCLWPGCDKRFPIKSTLNRHLLTHEEVKQHSCDWPGCEFKCCYAHSLRAHRLRHNDERPYECSWPDCDCSFRLSHHLKAHMLKHTGERPYLCDWPDCSQRFRSRQAMRFHSERAHKSHFVK